MNESINAPHQRLVELINDSDKTYAAELVRQEAINRELEEADSKKPLPKPIIEIIKDKTAQ